MISFSDNRFRAPKCAITEKCALLSHFTKWARVNEGQVPLRKKFSFLIFLTLKGVQKFTSFVIISIMSFHNLPFCFCYYPLLSFLPKRSYHEDVFYSPLPLTLPSSGVFYCCIMSLEFDTPRLYCRIVGGLIKGGKQKVFETTSEGVKYSLNCSI